MLEYPLGRPESTREERWGSRGIVVVPAIAEMTSPAAQSFYQAVDYIGQPAFVAIETGDHRRQHFVGIQFLDFERVAGMVGQ